MSYLNLRKIMRAVPRYEEGVPARARAKAIVGLTYTDEAGYKVLYAGGLIIKNGIKELVVSSEISNNDREKEGERNTMVKPYSISLENKIISSVELIY